MEEYRDVISYKGHYQVSNQGNVKSLKTNKILKPSLCAGYYGLRLSKNNIQKRKLIHRLVAEAFIPKENDKMVVNHKNGIKTDNYMENLEWVYQKDNIKHAKETGLNMLFGEMHGHSVLTEEQVLSILPMLESGLSRKHICEKLKVSRYVIEKIIHGKNWKYLNLDFSKFYNKRQSAGKPE